jgi:hypothetical protein
MNSPDLLRWLELRAPRAARLAKLWKRAYRARTLLPRWRELAEDALPEQTTGDGGSRRVLLATNVGGFVPGTMIESLLGAALTLRGAECHALLCDSTLPACLACENGFYPDMGRLATRGPQGDLCHTCFEPAAKCFGELGIRIHRYSDLLSANERSEAVTVSAGIALEHIQDFACDGLAVGEHAMAGALRFFARGDLRGEAYAEPIVRRYLEAALLTMYATRRLCQDVGFDVAAFHHGIYVPQGVVGEVARQQGVRVVNWNAAYRKHCFIFSHQDTYHHTLMTESAEEWECLEWTEAHEETLLSYLRSRWDGRNDWISFQQNPQLEVEAIESETGVDLRKPTIALFTNVVWDAQLHYPANAFPSMLSWLMGTVDYFQRRPDLQLVVRVHPAEVLGSVPSRQLVEEEIRRAFPTLPANVFVIPPTSRVSSYVLAERCDASIIYGTKMGVELSSRGIPVIVAGEAWIRGKGITQDADGREDYYRLLDRLPIRGRMSSEATNRARRYAYHFFFRRMIPLASVASRAGWPPFEVRVDNLNELKPGEDLGLDVICDGILLGRPFVYPAERLPQSSLLG